MSNIFFRTNRFLLSLLFFSFLITSSFLAQEKADKDKKYDQLNGKIEKVTVKVDGKDVVFEGEDAEKIGKHIKMFSKSPMIWISKEDGDVDADGKKVMFYSIREKDGADWSEKGTEEKKVQVKIEDGKKKVTVTTEKDGKEETKVYEGEEAEKFLQEHEKPGGEFQIKIDGKKGIVGDVMMFKSMDDDDEGCCCCGKMSKRMHVMPFKGKGDKKIIIEKKIEKEEKENKK